MIGMLLWRYFAERFRDLKHSDHAIPWSTVITIGGIAIAVSIAGFIREATTAREFGLGGDLDALFFAFAILLAVVGPLTSGLTGTIVPSTTALQLSGDKSLPRHVWSSTIASVWFGGLAGVVVTSTALLLTGAITGPNEIAAESVTKLLLILGVTAAVTIPVRSAAAAHLQAMGVIHLPSLSQALPPAIATLHILVSASPVPATVARGYAIGAILDAAVVLGLLGIRVSPRSVSFRKLAGRPQAVFNGIWTIALGSLVFGLNPVIDLIIAGRLGEGMAARVGLGSRIPVGVAVLFATSIGLPMFKVVSTLSALGRPTELLRTARRATLEAGIVSTIVAFSLALLSPFLSLLLVGGDWSEDARSVALIMCIFAAGIPVYVTGSPWAQTLIAVGAHRLILLLGLSGSVINVLLDLLLGHLWGATGIAVATVAVYTTNLLAMIYLTPVVLTKLRRPTLTNDPE